MLNMNIKLLTECKAFKELDFQIMIRKIDIKNLEKSVNKIYKLAGSDGPKGLGGMDYSRVTSSTPAAHIGLDDVVRLTKRNYEKIKVVESEIAELRAQKKNLIKMLNSLDGLKKQLFYNRVLMCLNQKEAADEIGLSERQLQRIEKQIKSGIILFELQKTELFF